MPKGRKNEIENWRYMQFCSAKLVLSSPENRDSISRTNRKLLKKWPPFFYFEMDNSYCLPAKLQKNIESILLHFVETNLIEALQLTSSMLNHIF
jgi:hypothetical protein